MYTFSVELFLLVENDYKAGTLSQGQALDKLNKIYKAGLKEFKKRTEKIMKKYEFYRFVPDGIDGLISIYESGQDTNLYSQIIKDFLVKISTTPDQGKKPNKLDFDQAMAAIHKERDEIMKLCRERDYIEEYYNEYLAKIVRTSDPIQQPKNISERPQQIKKSGHPILSDLVDAGQLKTENGEYIPYKSMPDFIAWCSENGYIDEGDKKNKYKDDLTPMFVYENIKHTCTIETIKRYFRDVKNQRLREKPKNG